jgi:hypothetical protein
MSATEKNKKTAAKTSKTEASVKNAPTAVATEPENKVAYRLTVKLSNLGGVPHAVYEEVYEAIRETLTGLSGILDDYPDRENKLDHVFVIVVEAEDGWEAHDLWNELSDEISSNHPEISHVELLEREVYQLE